ncbi:MAG: nucleotide exchange factor GrpE [Candidatus Levybacteria bacterium]|nr:nucleotide exchange factor GrpE [Candidatus Levybacteria bacterium]
MDDKKTKKQKQDEPEQEVVVEEELETEADGLVTELEEKNKSLEDQLKRAVADYRNLENRNRDEKLEFIKFANKNLIEQLLPAFDTLLLAEKYTDDQNFKVTVKHVLEVLKNAGIERVETQNKEYNPVTMEAIEVVDGEENKVVEELQPGFTLFGKTIRPARVKVGGKKES